MKATLTVAVKRPECINERKVKYVEWLEKIRSNGYANNHKVEEGLNRII
jgi:hypothetical protein